MAGLHSSPLSSSFDGRPAPLFTRDVLEEAEDQEPGSPFRRLALSRDPEAKDMRRVLEHCWPLAGDAGGPLRTMLMHEHWGQHSGALAHLLALGLFAREGFEVSAEPSLDDQSPDILVRKAGHDVLVEVRAVTGAGAAPWRDRPQPGKPSSPVSPRRGSELIGARGWGLAATNGTPQDALADTLVRVLERKADAYRDLARARRLPYVICLYQDTDSQVSSLVCDLVFGRSQPEPSSRGGFRQVHDPKAGLFWFTPDRFRCVSAVLVFGRLDTEEGDMRVVGDLIINPWAGQPLPAAADFPDLRTYRITRRVQPARMRWNREESDAFEIAPHP